MKKGFLVMWVMRAQICPLFERHPPDDVVLLNIPALDYFFDL
jgi:hypothetical protein